MRKLVDYSLSKSHPEGRHKARVFKAALGVTAENAVELQVLILEGVRHHPAEQRATINHGVLYVVDMILERAGKRALVRTGWIVRTGEDFPRLTTAYVL